MKFYVALFSLLIILSVMLSLNQASAAPTISIETNQSVYEYGDHLVMIINVSEVTGDDVRIFIIDPAERKGLLLQSPMPYVYTEFPARFPFDATVYKPGTYLLELEYSGAQSSVQFTIEDTGKIALPFWIKDLAKMWVIEPFVTDKDFARAIEYLIKVEVIKIPYVEPIGETESAIPEWVKNNARWWIEGKISDTEFTMALQYLIKIGIIKVNVSTLEAT